MLEPGRPAVAWRGPLAVASVALFGLAAGSALIAYSFHLAATGGDTASIFASFWVGALIAMLPLVLVATSARTESCHRILAVVGIAAVTTLPKLLRNPAGPLFHDEYAHLRAVDDILASGAPDGFNSIVMPAPYFPGLHYVTAWLSGATTMNSWQSGLVLVAVAHVVGLVALYALARAVGVSSRGAAVAAVVYATNANWMFFHSQFSYESLGLPLALVILAAAARAMRSPRGRWLAVGLLAPAGYLVATVHHLSALAAVAIMLAMTVSTTFLSRSRAMTLAMWAGLVSLGLGIAVRLASVSDLLLNYLGSPVNRGVFQLQDIVSELLGSSDGSARALTLFDNSIAPGYERIAGFLVPPILALAVVAYLLIWLRQRRMDNSVLRIPAGTPLRAGLLWFGLLYFVSLPLMFTAGGNEGGRRSWGYTMIGLAILVGVLIDALGSSDARGRIPRPVAAAATLAWVVLLVGGVATGVNVAYRFPLPEKGVSDLTAATAETEALGDWFAQNADPNTWVLTDRYSSMTIAGRGGMRVANSSARAFPYSQLYYSIEPPSPKLMGEIWALGAQYLVVDRRMTTVIPGNGWWMGPDDPQPAPGQFFATDASLAKFDYLPWVAEVYASENYVVYQLDLARYNPYETATLIEEHHG